MPDGPTDLLKRAEEIHPGSISPEDYEEIFQLGSQFATMEGDHRIFVLGNYGPVKRERLDEVEETIRTYPEASCSAFQMSDLLDEDEALNGILKYRLLADHATDIVAVCEDDQGGVVVEQGMLVVLPDHLRKSFLCKREYTEDLETQRYSWMQSQGIFEIFEDTERLRTWRTPEELIEEIEGILDSIT